MINGSIFLKGDEGDFIAPSISVSLGGNNVNAHKIEKLKQSTRAFIESKGFKLANIHDVEIKDMDAFGEGLFAKNDIAEGTVVAVCGGTIHHGFEYGTYTRDCTAEKHIMSDSMSACYKFCSITGEGDCASDKIQHAFDKNMLDIQDHLPPISTDLKETFAYPNIKIKSIQTNYDFAIVLLLAERRVKAGEIFLTDYGFPYVSNPRNNMDPTAVFNTRGKVIAELKLNNETGRIVRVDAVFDSKEPSVLRNFTSFQKSGRKIPISSGLESPEMQVSIDACSAIESLPGSGLSISKPIIRNSSSQIPGSSMSKFFQFSEEKPIVPSPEGYRDTSTIGKVEGNFEVGKYSLSITKKGAFPGECIFSMSLGNKKMNGMFVNELMAITIIKDIKSDTTSLIELLLKMGVTATDMANRLTEDSQVADIGINFRQ